MADKIKELLEKNGQMIIDGSMSTALEQMGANLNCNLWTARALVDTPELVKKVHTDYFKAGADCGITCSYQATIPGLMENGFTHDEAAEIVAIATKIMLLGRAKSCRWQVFVRRRPPKQGELRTDVSKATMFQGVDSVLRPRFKALPEILLEKLSNGTSRNRFSAQNGGEKALNRCDVPVLQRKDLERTSKEQPYSLRTVGYGWVRICGV